MSEEYTHKNQNPIIRVKRTSVLGITLALLLAVGAFFSGLQSSQIVYGSGQVAGLFSIFSSPEKEVTSEIDMTEFWEIWGLLEDRFITASSTKVVTDEQKLYGAIQGLVDSYDDPYTVFLPPTESEAFAEDISGNFTGIGMEVGNKKGVISVIAPLSGTPAEAAGILPGDLITAIDGVTTEGMLIEEAVKRIRGEKGTVVTLSMFREGDTEIRKVPVTRDIITIPTVKTEQVGDVFMVSLYSFNAVAEEKMNAAMQAYVKSNAKKMILDLRGNPGGYLEGAVGIAGFMLPVGKIVVKERFGEAVQERLYRSQGQIAKNLSTKNFVVLVDNGSASASEILAGALKEHGLATVIGVNTYGKGSVQELIPLPDGSALKVTVARWFTPNGVSISEGGLVPDFSIKRTPQQRLDDIDPQKDAALRFLKGETIVSEQTPT